MSSACTHIHPQTHAPTLAHTNAYFQMQMHKAMILPLEGDKEQRHFSESDLPSHCCFPRYMCLFYPPSLTKHLAQSLDLTSWLGCQKQQVQVLPLLWNPLIWLLSQLQHPRLVQFIMWGPPLIFFPLFPSLLWIPWPSLTPLSVCTSPAWKEARLLYGICTECKVVETETKEYMEFHNQPNLLPPLQSLLWGLLESLLFGQGPFCHVFLKLAFTGFQIPC